MALYLPESFEWLILSSGILKNNSVTEILSTPYDYAESEKYFSDTAKAAILSVMEKIQLDWKKR